MAHQEIVQQPVGGPVDGGAAVDRHGLLPDSRKQFKELEEFLSLLQERSTFVALHGAAVERHPHVNAVGSAATAKGEKPTAPGLGGSAELLMHGAEVLGRQENTAGVRFLGGDVAVLVNFQQGAA
jgi:hypothetical protein